MSYTNGLDKPTDYFNTKLFTGNNSANHSITGVGFQPDLIWFKSRNNAHDHSLVDSVRGRKAIASNDTYAEITLNADKDFQSFDSDGFTVDVVEQLNSFNRSGEPIVTWNWLAGGTASSNTDGSITSSVSANTTAGFSIVSYTGTGSNATVGHGLGVAPSVIIIKHREKGSGYNWVVYHHKNTSAPETDFLKLNLTDATADDNTMFNDTAPTSSVFSIGTAGLTNNNTFGHIAYCFAEKKGYSKFGSYTGNGSTDGTFVYTGFKPAWVLIKNSSTGNISWTLYDNKRPGYNEDNAYLLPSSSDSELSDKDIDLLSNGFKPRTSNSALGTSGDTYIYMCFAEAPFVTSTGIPTTAR